MIRKTELYKDDRGLLLFASPTLLKFDYEYLTIGTMKPNSVRGGHYHKRIFEKLLCVSGQLTMKLDGEKFLLLPGHVIDIPVGVRHTVYNTGEEEAVFVEFKSEEFNEDDKDTYS